MNTLKEVLQSFIKNPTATFCVITIGGCMLLYSDLRSQMDKNMEVQQETVKVLNELTIRVTDIERKLSNH